PNLHSFPTRRSSDLRFLRVARCESDFANARLAQAKEEVTAQESQVVTAESTKNELEAAKVALAQLTEAAELASQKRERAELDFADRKSTRLNSSHQI